MNFEFSDRVKTAVADYRDVMFAAAEYIAQNPALGFKEWKAHRYLKEVFEEMGFTLHEPGNIPGFYFDIDSGRPGPTVCIMGELDAVEVRSHPNADPETGAVHACGHNCQAAYLIGVAGAFKDESLLNRISGRVRIMAVPSEELIDFDDRLEMRREGKLKYFGGKTEFMARGYLDDVDISLIIHSAAGPGRKKDDPPFLSIDTGTIASLPKRVHFTGKTCHAASPQNGINALYAAHVALAAVNSLRDNFVDGSGFRFHPIITEGGAQNTQVPASVRIETSVRAADAKTLLKANLMMNRALTAGALAIGAQIEIEDLDVYMPEENDPALNDLLCEVGADVLGKDRVFDHREIRGTGSSDMGNVSCIMPVYQPFGCGGIYGRLHEPEYRLEDLHAAVELPAVVLVGSAIALLQNGGERAAKIAGDYKPLYPNSRALLDAIDSLCTKKNPITYGENSASVDWN